MSKGQKCPNPKCGKQTFVNKGGFLRCTKCAAIGWGWNKPVKDPGKGKGNKCPNCEVQTLHRITDVLGAEIRRCATCDYSLIIPPTT